MVIKNWGLSPSPTYGTLAPWPYKLLLNPGDYMAPPLAGGYGDLTNVVGLYGQGNNMPAEKVFDRHFVVNIPTALGDQYYDPSYGVTYASEAAFEAKAVAGYAAKIPLEDGPTDGNYHFRIPTAGSPNIQFTLVTNNSM